MKIKESDNLAHVREIIEIFRFYFLTCVLLFLPSLNKSSSVFFKLSKSFDIIGNSEFHYLITKIYYEHL